MLALADLILAVDHHEPSKTPFYIAAGVLVLWGVVVSMVSMARPDFPTQASASRAVMGLSFVLVVAAMATAVITS